MDIRMATPDDAEMIARLHVQSWAETYTGILPQSEHEARNLMYRYRLWSRVLGDPKARVALAPDLGFAQVGPQRDTALKGAGFDQELYCLYVLQAGHGTGTAQSLLKTALTDPFQPFTAMVLDNNPRACAFYEKVGGRWLETRDERIGATPIKERVYGWDAPPNFTD